MLDSTLAKFVTIWWLFSSKQYDVLVKYIISIKLHAPCNYLPLYKQCLKNSGIAVNGFLLVNINHHKWCLKNIESWIQNHIISRTTTNGCSYRMNLFKYTHFNNKALRNFINGESNTGIFYFLNFGSIQSTPSLETSRTFPQFSIVNT